MMTSTGQIQAVSWKNVNTKRGPRELASFRMDGDWFNVGFISFHPEKGMFVEVQYEKNSFGNQVSKIKEIEEPVVASIAHSESPSPTPTKTSYVKKTYPIAEDDPQMAIIMQNAMKQVLEAYKLRPDFIKDLPEDEFWWKLSKDTVTTAHVLSGIVTRAPEVDFADMSVTDDIDEEHNERE